MKSLSINGKDAGCGSRYAVEGVTFRMIGFPAYNDIDVNDPRLQNLLAYRCYGSTDIAASANYPFDAMPTYGALDAMRDTTLPPEANLTDCDVPIALIRWKDGKIDILDMWAVRRQPTPTLTEPAFPMPIGPRRMSEAVAMFLQFQDQVGQALPAAGDIGQSYRFLPPAGYLTDLPESYTPATLFKAFDTAGALHQFTLAPAEFRRLVASSWLLEPIDLDAVPLPDLNVYLHRNGTDLLFVRSDTSKPIVVVPPKGSIHGQVIIPIALIRQLQIDPFSDDLVITAKDSVSGNTVNADLAEKTFNSSKGITVAFAFDSLPPATYTVTADAKKVVGTKEGVVVFSNHVTQIRIELAAKSEGLFVTGPNL